MESQNQSDLDEILTIRKVINTRCDFCKDEAIFKCKREKPGWFKKNGEPYKTQEKFIVDFTLRNSRPTNCYAFPITLYAESKLNGVQALFLCSDHLSRMAKELV